MIEDKPTLLLVDDDDTFRSVLRDALQKRGFMVSEACDVTSAMLLITKEAPEYAVIDLKMPGDSGLVLVRKVSELQAGTNMVVLTGYASISTAIEAIKLGATHYLAKPVDADDIVSAFEKVGGNSEISVANNPLSVDRLAWEHIQRVLNENDGNISATARALNMHRRTLQRKLNKNPSKK